MFVYMNIRIIQKDDYHKKILDLYNQLSPTNNIDISNFSDFIKSLNKKHNIYVIECDNIIVACCTYFIETKILRNLSKVFHIEDLIVDKNFRGFGYGKQMVDFMIDLAQNEQCYKIILDCDDDHAGFYAKCGLQKKNIQMGQYFTNPNLGL